ncbi:MAG: hypothetical protein Q4B58_06970 [Bacteroidales bacterium]|nr:hypothetical protein [Bacteroidales bacterium]
MTEIDIYNANWPELLREMRGMSRKECKEKYGKTWLMLWDGLHIARYAEQEVVIRLMAGGNEYMQPGDSKCGVTPGIGLDVPIVIEHPNGSWYRGGTILEIDWEDETFKTAQSTYSFHVVRR